ncbi:hypothetical protein J5X84_41200 [Streptosporangiaceae bacterium NEAU-GS5]|nr:hypothetical protein [Streptosporangiaceae bacterium NEAU-GS5]
MATLIKRCSCEQTVWASCPHSWVVRYRGDGGRAGRQRERRFTDRREARDFLLKVEYDKRAGVFIDPADGRVRFQDYAQLWLDQRVIAERTVEGYESVLRVHINPAFGTKYLGVIRRSDIKNLVATMRRKGLSGSRIAAAHLVIHAVFNEAVRDKLLSESPCVDIELPVVSRRHDFIVPTRDQVEALAADLPGDWAATIWLMHGCGLRIGEALAVSLKCRIAGGQVLRVTEQVSPRARVVALKFRNRGDYRDIPLPRYVSEAIDKHVADHGTGRGVICSRGASSDSLSGAPIRRTSLTPPARSGCRLGSRRIRFVTCSPRPLWPRASLSPRSPDGSAIGAWR